MKEDVMIMLFVMGFVFGIMLLIALIGLISDEQEHRHKIELEKAKNGIFDNSSNSFLKKHIKLILVVIVIIIILVCYFFNVPSNLLKYILEIIS